MRSKIAISLSSADREAIAKWYVWMISIVALVVSLVFMLPIFKSPLPNSFSTTATERSPGAVYNGGYQRARIVSASPQSSDIGCARRHVELVPIPAVSRCSK
jgi:hypothetical protein